MIFDSIIYIIFSFLHIFIIFVFQFLKFRFLLVVFRSFEYVFWFRSLNELASNTDPPCNLAVNSLIDIFVVNNLIASTFP